MEEQLINTVEQLYKIIVDIDNDVYDVENDVEVRQLGERREHLKDTIYKICQDNFIRTVKTNQILATLGYRMYDNLKS